MLIRRRRPRSSLTGAVVLPLAWFSLRRVVFLAAALRRPRAAPSDVPSELPTVTVAVPAHNEASTSERLTSALGALDYPAERLSFVLVCDGCSDETPARFRAWASDRANAHVLELSRRSGKARALNEALTVNESDVVVTLDADLAPRPDFLRKLIPVFADPKVGAAAALLRPANATSGPIARYAALDSWVNQLIGSAGKDRLGLNPLTFGASAYRRGALVDIGGFWPAPSGEDVEAALALTRAGWRTRFVSTAVAENRVVSSAREYWDQHVRWARGNFVARNARPLPARGRLVDRLEAWNVSAGYLDRVLFLASVPLVARGKLPRWLPAAYLAIPGGEVLAALVKAGARKDLHRFALAAIAIFPLDVVASIGAILVHLRQRPHVWRSPR
jgi:cellulose synthase/poly-beta-1,6-N-acetylglucosamine synthase-like glycosyltransferase